MSSAEEEKSGSTRKQPGMKLRPDAKKLLDALAKETGYKHGELVRRLLIWYAKRDALTQAWAMGFGEEPAEWRARVREMARRMEARTEEPRRGAAG